MNHRLKPGETQEGEPAKAALRELVHARQISGILAFADDEPIGWCAFDRMARLPGLDCGYAPPSGQESSVWAIHCVSVLSGYSKDAVTEQMVAAAMCVMKREGAELVEGYPPPTVPSDNSFSGTVAIFARQGFARREDVSKFYTRMVKTLDRQSKAKHRNIS